MSTVDERELLTRLSEGDEHAFVSLYDRYKDALAARLLYLLKSETLAEEALQDLFMKVWSLRMSIDPEKSFQAYLYRIAISLVYDTFRKAKRQHRVFHELAAANTGWYTHIEETIIDRENRGLLETILRRLPNKRRKIFVACKLEGKSYKEVAKEFSISTTTVNDHIQKATQYVKVQLQSADGFWLVILISCILSNK